MSALRRQEGIPPSPPSPLNSVAPSPAALPSGLGDGIWRGCELGHTDTPTIPTGFAALDAALPGQGWPTRALTEILLPQAALCEWRLVAPGLAALAAAGGQVLLVAPPKRPHAAGLAQRGLDADHLVWIDAATPAERLWTTEQLVKSNPQGAILSWLPQARPEQIRRLQVRAQSCDAPVFLFRPIAAERDASPAPLRLSVALGRDWNLQVRIVKRRGASHAGVLLLPSVPERLAAVLPPRLRQAAQPILIMPPSSPLQEAADARALGSASPADPHRHPAGH